MTVPAPSTSPAAPDWSAISHRVICPLCEYELRGLTEPRCPECGYSFQWSEVIDPDRQPHPYLFEHHPREPLWSFWKTLIGGRFPRKFWTALNPIQQSKPLRLLAYWLLTSLIGITGTAVATRYADINSAFVKQAGSFSYRATPFLAQGSVRIDRLGHWLVGWSFDRLYFRLDSIPFVAREHAIPVVMILTMLLWPAATYIVLLIFAASMDHAKVRKVHVVRCLVYSNDAITWTGLGVACIMGIYAALAAQSATIAFSPWPVLAMLLVAWWLTFVWRLYASYRFYLRFDHPFATIASSQIILLLIAVLLAL